MSRHPEDQPIKLLRRRLDGDGVVAHCESLARRAEAIEVRTKAGAAARSSDIDVELDEARRQLLAGDVAAVQIHFFADGAWWCDTLLRRGDSFRLVRMRQGEAP